jgi:hypothetical protein
MDNLSMIAESRRIGSFVGRTSIQSTSYDSWVYPKNGGDLKFARKRLPFQFAGTHFFSVNQKNTADETGEKSG